MILQNHTGLDILLMKQRELCMVLGKICCFYPKQLHLLGKTFLWSVKTPNKDTEETTDIHLCLPPPTDHITASINLNIDSYHDPTNCGTLHPQLHGQLHQTENKLS